MPFQVSIATRPNDQTDVSTARKWSQKVLGEREVEIADVVQRCPGCSFGSKLSFTDKRFREVVYAGIIQPLQDYLKTGQFCCFLEERVDL